LRDLHRGLVLDANLSAASVPVETAAAEHCKDHQDHDDPHHCTHELLPFGFHDSDNKRRAIQA
jgi:hypothetical protein